MQSVQEKVQEKVESVAGAVTDLLQGNPFSTPVGQHIESATDGSLASENWGLNMEICDIINQMESGPKDAIRAIRKRLQQNMGKNHTVVMYTLTVLETCVKNCGVRFHLAVAQKDFIQELVKLIGPKFDPAQVVQEKVLALIQSWADAFRQNPELHPVVDVYEELKSKGVDFPMTDLDNMAPIYTPSRTVVAKPLPSRNPDVPPAAVNPCPAPASGPQVSPQRRMPMTPFHLTPEQMSKLRSELDVVHNNLTVFREMLTELHPGQEANDEFQLLQDLNKTCHSMQTRIVELLGVVADEEVTSQLLLMNDELNNVFEKYNRYMANRNLTRTGQEPTSADGSTKPLIDFGGESESGAKSISSKLAAASNGHESINGASSIDRIPTVAASTAANFAPPTDEHRTRVENSFPDDQVAGIGSAVEQKSKLLASSPEDKEQDLKEAQQWLQQQNGDSSAEGTTKEFDKFLSERATAGERSGGSPESGQQSQTRQVKRKEDEEEKMFAL